MELLDHVHTSGLLEQVSVSLRFLAALVILLIMLEHHFHQLKLETATSVTELFGLTASGQEKAAQVIIHAVHSIL